jgi:hypothetical protein
MQRSVRAAMQGRLPDVEQIRPRMREGESVTCVTKR